MRLNAAEIDIDKLEAVQNQIADKANIVNEIVGDAIGPYCSKLDQYVAFIKTVLADTKNPPTDVELDDFALNLPTLMYFASSAQEAIGIHEDIAKAVWKEVFSNEYDLANGTVGDKTASAELATQTEYITQIIYQRAYKKIKLRMEIAGELLQSVKKVMSRRMAECDISRDGINRQGGV